MENESEVRIYNYINDKHKNQEIFILMLFLEIFIKIKSTTIYFDAF